MKTGVVMRTKSEQSFWIAALIVFALLTGLDYLPALWGKVPFPRDIVLGFPAWNGLARSEAWQPYADIGDLVTAFYPARAFAARAIHEGSLPLWNPYFLGGAPFLASPQSSLFYPPNVLYYVLSLPTAWTLCLMLRLFLSGIFMTLFVRSIGGSKAGSIFSGVVFAFCGFMTAWQGQPMDDSAAWLPFICYAVVRLQRAPSKLSIALAAFGFAMPVVAGHPEAAAHVTLVAIALALMTWACSRFDFRFLWRFAVAGLLAAGLASIQMIPTLEWLTQLPFALNVRWPVLPLHQLLAWVSRDVLRGPNSAGIWVPEGAAYVGMITLLAAPFGFFHRARRYAIFFAVLTVAAIAGAYGIEPVHWLISGIPVLASLKNGRLLLLASFGLAALAGLGISRLEEDIPWPRGRRALALALVTIVFGLTFLLVYKLQLATVLRVEFTRRPSFSRSLLLIGLILLLWRLYGGLRGRAFPIAACAIVTFDLLTFSYGYTMFSRRDEIFPPTPLFDFLAKHGDPSRFRIASMGLPYPANANIMYGVPSADGYEVRLTPPHRIFSWDYTEDRMDGIFFVPSRILRFNDRRLDLLNVKYLAVVSRSLEFRQFTAGQRFSLAYNNGYVALFENKSVLPRAFAVPLSGLQVLSEVDQQLGTLRNPSFDPQQSVFVSDLPASLNKNSPQSATSGLPLSNTVDVVASRINETILRTATSQPTVLILSQTYYPGWKATVDGKDTEVFPADITLTGIRLPPGAHEVRFAFRPRSFVIGAGLTFVSVVCLLLLLVLHRRLDAQLQTMSRQV